MGSRNVYFPLKVFTVPVFGVGTKSKNMNAFKVIHVINRHLSYNY